MTSAWETLFDYFGKYKLLAQSILISVAACVGLLMLTGCCCMPCMRIIFNRLIDKALGPVHVAMAAERVQLLIVDEDDIVLND